MSETAHVPETVPATDSPEQEPSAPQEAPGASPEQGQEMPSGTPAEPEVAPGEDQPSTE